MKRASPARRRRVYGVVLSVPPLLSRRANRVRRSYDPNFLLIFPHITVLPPRPLALTRREVVAAVGRIAQMTPPFELDLSSVGTFLPAMPVVFVGLRRGKEALDRLHRRLDRGVLHGEEAFPYVPHLTLGQALLDRTRLSRALALSKRVFTPSLARSRWRVDSLIIVERRSPRRWASPPPVPLAGRPGRKDRSDGKAARR